MVSEWRIRNGFWNGTTWLLDECKGTKRKFSSEEKARKAAKEAYEQAKANGEQTQDRFYLNMGGELSSLFLD